MILITLKTHKQRQKSFCCRSVKISEDHSPRHSLRKINPKASPLKGKRKQTIKPTPNVFEVQNLSAVEAFNFCFQMSAETAIAINFIAFYIVALGIVKGVWKSKNLFSPGTLQWENRLP